MAGCNKIDLHSNHFGFGIESHTIKYISTQIHEWRYSDTAGEDGDVGMKLDHANLAVNGNVIASRAGIGNSSHTDYACFGHKDHYTSSTNYGLIQHSSGGTILNLSLIHI